MTNNIHLNNAILRTKQAMIMNKNGLVRMALIAKELARQELRKARSNRQ